MKLVEILSLLAGLMTMAAPGAQAVKTIRSRETAGLSVGSYVLLLCLGFMGILLGVQYRIVAMTALNALNTSFNLIILYLISRRKLALLLTTLLATIGIAALTAPWFLEGLVTTRWSEPFAFVYGLVGASTFLPQVLLTRRTRIVAAISLSNLLLMTFGIMAWIVVAVLLHNWSLSFWNSLLLLMVIELLRLKIMVERAQSQSISTPVLPRQ